MSNLLILDPKIHILVPVGSSSVGLSLKKGFDPKTGKWGITELPTTQPTQVVPGARSMFLPDTIVQRRRVFIKMAVRCSQTMP